MTVKGYCGLFGSGKTYAAVLECYGARRRDNWLPIMTNLGRLDLPGIPVEYLHIGEGEAGLDAMWAKLGGFKHGILLLDEVGVFLPARLWNKIPIHVSQKWAQLRKDGVDLLWTCIRPANAVKDLRDITFETCWCNSWQRFGFFALAWYSYTAVGDKRYFQGRQFKLFRPGLAGKLYDTYGKVNAPLWAGSSAPPKVAPLVTGDVVLPVKGAPRASGNP